MNELDIIVTYFKTDLLVGKCVDRLLQTDSDFIIWLVDNTQVSKNILMERFPDTRVKVIRGASPQGRSGYTRGRHHPEGTEIGLKSSSAPYVALFHCDSWPIVPDWYAKCKAQLGGMVDLVGLQHESSIHHSFHLCKREVISKYKHRYSKKSRFTPKLLKLVEHPEYFTDRRHKWDFGEELAIKIYKAGRHTIGLPPSRACLPDSYHVDWNTWRSYKESGYGLIYGEQIFHFWRSFKHFDKIKDVLDFFESDRYLTECHYHMPNNEFILNDGIHHNGMYLEEL